MKILNLITDEKFMDGVVRSLDLLDIQTDYIWLTRTIQPYKYMHLSERVKQVLIGSEQYDDYLKSDDYDYVWVHYADSDKMTFAALYAGRAKVVWSAWGGDYLSLLHFHCFEPRTLKFWFSTHTMRACIGYVIRAFAARVGLSSLLFNETEKGFLSKVSYFSTVLPSEEHIVRKLLQNTAKYIPFRYTDLSREFDTTLRCEENCLTIWVGNSASYTNNTLDVFCWLKKMRQRIEVFCPLSYGSDAHRERVLKEGERIFGVNWHPIIDFMPYDDYCRVMRQCGVFIFYHRRQEAMGNVFAALRSGGLVVLNRRSPAWKYFTDLGVRVYGLDEIQKGIEGVYRDFIEKHQRKNVQLVFEGIRLSTRFDAMRNAFRTLEQDVVQRLTTGGKTK